MPTVIKFNWINEIFTTTVIKISKYAVFLEKSAIFCVLAASQARRGIGSKIRFPLFFHSQIFHLKKGIIALHMLYIDLYFLISKSANLSPNLRLLRFYGYQRSAVMCPSYCSAPIPPLPRCSSGIRRKMGVMKKDGALEKRVNLVIIQSGAVKKESDKRTGVTKTKSDFPGGARGMGSELFDQRIQVEKCTKYWEKIVVCQGF